MLSIMEGSQGMLPATFIISVSVHSLSKQNKIIFSKMSSAFAEEKKVLNTHGTSLTVV
jgi:hypothetical protein